MYRARGRKLLLYPNLKEFYNIQYNTIPLMLSFIRHYNTVGMYILCTCISYPSMIDTVDPTDSVSTAKTFDGVGSVQSKIPV